MIRKRIPQRLRKREKAPKKLAAIIPWTSTTAKDIRDWRIPGMRERTQHVFTQDRIGVTLFSTLNKIKEVELRQKVAAGKKVRVAFVLDSLSKFKTMTVYRYMLADPLFEPFLVLYTTFEIRLENDIVWREYCDDLQRLREKDYRVKPGYDEKRKPIPIETYLPDLVIVNSLYLDKVYMAISQTFLNINYLTCVFNYGFNIILAHGYDYFYNNPAVNTAWKHFVETAADFDEFRRFSRHFGANSIYLGAPALDLYRDPEPDFKLPAKIDNDKPIVIYAPHHSIGDAAEGYNLATFHLYHQYFYELARDNADINFILKPHPSLGNRLAKRKIMSREKYREYIDRFAALPNAIYYFDSDYIELFKLAALLITDSGSFIVEWLPSGSPCLYLVSPERNPQTFLDFFSPLAKSILKTYYLCHNLEEAQRAFRNILIDHQDPLKGRRLDLCAELFPDIGNAGKKITAYLHDVLKGVQ